jgi:hypothetical protein
LEKITSLPVVDSLRFTQFKLKQQRAPEINVVLATGDHSQARLPIDLRYADASGGRKKYPGQMRRSRVVLPSPVPEVIATLVERASALQC